MLNAGKTFNAVTGYFDGGTKLLDFGRSTGPIFQSGDRVVAQPFAYSNGAGWVLWDTVSGNQLASGSSGTLLGAAGTAFLVRLPTMAGEIRALSDGHLMGTVQVNAIVEGLASDGSYVWGHDGGLLSAWDLSGTLMHASAGPVSGPTFAAPSELRVLSGQNVQYLNVTSGAQTVSSSAFTGSAYGWFADGSHFLTLALGQVHRIYTPDVVLAGTLNMQGGQLGGYGDYFWNAPNIYSFGSVGADPNAPVPLATLSGGTWMLSGNLIAAVSSSELKLAHLDAVFSTETVPLPASWYSTPSAFAADTSGHWSAIGSGGSIYHRGTVSDPNASGFLGCGEPLDVTGSQSGLAAVVTGAGIVLVDTISEEAQVVPSVRRNHVALSDAGTLLLAGGDPANLTVTPGLDVFDLPGTAPYNWPGTKDFRLSRNGARLAQSCSNVVTDPKGGNPTTLVPQTNCSTPRLSPSGAYTALSDADPLNDSAMASPKLPGTSIYQGATLVNVVPGFAVGWIDDNRLLTQTYTFGTIPHLKLWTYASSYIYDNQGTLLATLPALPALVDFDTISPTQILSTPSGNVYDLTTGAAVGNPAPFEPQLHSPRRFAHAATSIVEAAEGIYIRPD